MSFVILAPDLGLLGDDGPLLSSAKALAAALDSTTTGGELGGILSYLGPAMKEEV